MSTRKTGTPEQARALNGCDHDRKMVTWPSADEIDGAKTPAGGWTRETLAQWGVPWPPPKGWRQALIARDRKFFKR